MSASNLVIARLRGGLGNQLFQYAAARRLAYRHSARLRFDLSSYPGGLDTRAGAMAAFPRQLALNHFAVEVAEASAEDLAQARGGGSAAGASTAVGVLERIAGRLRNVVDRRYGTAGALAGRALQRVRRAYLDATGPPRHVVEWQYEFEPRILALRPPVYLDGYWQSYRYFEDVAEVIERELVPRDPAITSRAEDLVAGLRRGGRQVVAVHVRRGDLAHAAEVAKDLQLVHGPPTDPAFVTRAMAMFPEPAVFLVFSDSATDIQWCKQNIAPSGTTVEFSEGQTDLEDFATMRACDHNIIANSSFSWWAAWLNPNPHRRIIAPRHWSDPRAPRPLSTRDLIPRDWAQC